MIYVHEDRAALWPGRVRASARQAHGGRAAPPDLDEGPVAEPAVEHVGSSRKDRSRSEVWCEWVADGVCIDLYSESHVFWKSSIRTSALAFCRFMIVVFIRSCSLVAFIVVSSGRLGSS